MHQKELNSLLIKKIEKSGIVYRCGSYDNQYAWISTTLGIGGYDKNCTPFDHAHEVGHIYYGDSFCENECDSFSKYESRASKYGIELLWEMFIETGGSPQYFDIFLDLTGCPEILSWNLINRIHPEYREKHFEYLDSTIPPEVVKIRNSYHDYANDQNYIETCVNDYYSREDIITEETFNIYAFMDTYELTERFVKMIVQTFNTLHGWNLNYNF